LPVCCCHVAFTFDTQTPTTHYPLPATRYLRSSFLTRTYIPMICIYIYTRRCIFSNRLRSIQRYTCFIFSVPFRSFHKCTPLLLPSTNPWLAFILVVYHRSKLSFQDKLYTPQLVILVYDDWTKKGRY
jgi:hypothetical protein